MSNRTLDRRGALTTLAAVPFAAGLAAVLNDPAKARAAAAGLEEVQLTTAGGRAVSASLARPGAAKAPAVLLIHEWWGLNDQIKATAAEFAKQGYLALAVDLYGGKAADAGDAAAARSLMQAVQQDQALDTLVSWLGWLRAHEASTGKVGTCGWCFGGGWSLNASIATPVDATVIYYGRVDRPVEDLKKLQGPVLGHFGTRDKGITPEMVQTFERRMTEAGRPATIYMYDADHAFANPTGARYDAEDAALAWQRTMTFLGEQLA